MHCKLSKKITFCILSWPLGKILILILKAGGFSKIHSILEIQWWAGMDVLLLEIEYLIRISVGT